MNDQPTRYKLRPIFWDYCQLKSVSKDQIDAMGNESAYSHKDGDWVKWLDYARLQAETQMMKTSMRGHSTTYLYQSMAEENARLQAELERLKEAWIDRKMHEDRDALLQQVERLTKAGDAMMVWIDHQYDDSGYQHSEAWEAAKGGQS